MISSENRFPLFRIMLWSRRRWNHALETDQRINPERRHLAPLDEGGILVRLRPCLQSRERKFGAQAQRPGPLRGPALDRGGNTCFRIEMVNEDDPPAGLHHTVAFAEHLLGIFDQRDDETMIRLD